MEEENEMEPKQSGIKAPRGTELTTKGWVQGAALRMLLNNLDSILTYAA
jgi:urocanate hydratase